MQKKSGEIDELILLVQSVENHVMLLGKEMRITLKRLL